MKPNYRIISFANSDLNPAIAVHQKSVFDKFQISLTQVVWQKNEEKYGRKRKDDGGFLYDSPDCNDAVYNDHPYFLEQTIKEIDVEFLIFFDVDCIPLTDQFLNILLNDISDKNTLSGAIQGPPNRPPHVGAYFVGFARQLYFDCECPVMTDNVHADPFQYFTQTCTQFGKKVKYWMPTDSGKEWHIPSLDIHYGFGTTFENMIYHQFQIRNSTNQAAFIQKCESVISA